MAGPVTYWHTLRHLRPVQLYGRVWFRLMKPRVDRRAPPALRRSTGAWVEPARRNASLVADDRFCFLNETHALSDRGWDDAGLDKLWRYNLHYFDDLNASAGSARVSWHVSLMRRWVAENLPGHGTGWEPYPTSLRIVNWIKWALAGNELPAECIASLAVQVRWLAGRLEIHLLGNHLFANAKALVFAGLFFDGAEAASWQEKALSILRRELPEQILSDGGHFELSTMYHALALEDMLDLCNLMTAFMEPTVGPRGPAMRQWRKRVGPMREWLTAMCHPDGEIAFFNDAALGVSPAPAELEEYAARLGFPPLAPSSDPIRVLGASGYVRVDRDSASVLLDVAPVGPDYLPAHAHADTLSFEMSLFGRRVFVNSGTSCYGSGAERLRQRGTAAHNTVVVDGTDSSEVWGGFRVARRARPLGLEIACIPAIDVKCAHDGYRRLLRRQCHLRHWHFGDCELVVEDTITGNFSRAQACFHLHPSITVQANGTRGPIAMLQTPDHDDIRFSVEGGALRVEPSTWHPEFGRSEPSQCIIVDFTAARLRTRIEWKRRA